jgi:energy coupling factor transporter S component ThiW
MSNNTLRITEVKTNPIILKIVVVAIFTALGVVLSYFNPFAYFSIYGAKPNPFIHLINCMSGVLLGPIYSILISIILAVLRNVTQTGSILAFPGGISGAVVVGIIAL